MNKAAFIPKEKGFWFPAEWEKHKATWLSYPHNKNSWPGKIHTIFPFYNRFILELAKGEEVHINVVDEAMQYKVKKDLEQLSAPMDNIYFHLHPTNDAWCRDHGPAFLKNKNGEKIIVNWDYNAWGGKYPYEKDTRIPALVAAYRKIDFVSPGIVMEGGSIDVNGQGSLLTTISCLLNKNRNPHLSQKKIEEYLINYYGVEQVLWLDEGIEGDDTNGHIDDITRFVNTDTVITMVEPNTNDPNHEPLKKNLSLLKEMRLHNGKQINIVEIPMPAPLYYEGQRLPCSYANFYIANSAVIVPVYNCQQDEKALDVLSACFPGKNVIGIDSIEIIWGLGSWHCLSQQEPE